MLAAELRGEPYSKAEHRRRLQALLIGRTEQAVEFKHANVSAVLNELGYPYIDGYKPRRNYQDLLRDVIIERLDHASDVRVAADALVESPVLIAPTIADILAIRVSPPIRERRTPVARDPKLGLAPIADYAERDQRSRSLGKLGEDLVMRYEHERLWKAGKKTWADKVEQVSVTRGDRVGYDIHSFEEDGTPRLIEVKTTRLAAMTPFFATRNEVRISDDNAEEYHLYRVYQFTREPRLFVLSGSLRDTCELDPANYIARIA
jgi:hypothetical protein